jgi:hypothetical protein
VKAGGGKLLIDVNWRPVFWDDLDKAKKEILSFLDKADIVKISDADLEYLYDMQFVTALLNPCAVSNLAGKKGPSRHDAQGGPGGRGGGRYKTQGLVGGDWLSALHTRLNCSVGQGRQWPVVRLDKVDVVKVSDADLEYPFVVQFGTALLNHAQFAEAV